MPRKYNSLQEQLEGHKKIDPITGCWLWTGRLNRQRGQMVIERKPYIVSRVSMHVYRDFDLKDSRFICHIRECPNRHCFNPEHLYIGTAFSNVMDAYAVRTRSKYWGRNNELARHNNGKFS